MGCFWDLGIGKKFLVYQKHDSWKEKLIKRNKKSWKPLLCDWSYEGEDRQVADWRKYLPHIHISNGRLVFSVSNSGSVFSVFWELEYNSRKKTVKNQMI